MPRYGSPALRDTEWNVVDQAMERMCELWNQADLCSEFGSASEQLAWP